jgi:aspartokinase
MEFLTPALMPGLKSNQLVWGFSPKFIEYLTLLISYYNTLSITNFGTFKVLLYSIWKMIVYKFGGASVKDASGIRNLLKIAAAENQELVIVVSAFGKTTNALEHVLREWLSGHKEYQDLLGNIYNDHLGVINELFEKNSVVQEKIDLYFSLLRDHLLAGNRGKYDYEYDQVVSYGEIWSTIIVEGFLKVNRLDSDWIDIRELLLTDDRHRDANILWGESQGMIRGKFDFKRSRICYPGFHRWNSCRTNDHAGQGGI